MRRIPNESNDDVCFLADERPKGGVIASVVNRSRLYFATNGLGVKLNNVLPARGNQSVKEAAKTNVSASANRKRQSPRFPTVATWPSPRYSSLSGSPPAPHGQVSSVSPCGAGYHYVYSLELKCHIMTQLGGTYNLCP